MKKIEEKVKEEDLNKKKDERRYSGPEAVRSIIEICIYKTAKKIFDVISDAGRKGISIDRLREKVQTEESWRSIAGCVKGVLFLLDMGVIKRNVRNDKIYFTLSETGVIIAREGYVVDLERICERLLWGSLKELLKDETKTTQLITRLKKDSWTHRLGPDSHLYYSLLNINQKSE